MGATTPAAFDPKPRQLGVVIDCIAGSAILAGQAVVISATGADYTVIPCDSDTSKVEKFVGIAMYSQATTGGHLAVASQGSVVLFQEGAGAGIDAGDNLMAGAAAGCLDVATDGADVEIAGYAITDAAVNGFGYMVVNAVYQPKGA